MKNSGKNLVTRKSNIYAASAISELLKTSFGPKGMHKMVIDSYGNLTVTNDGVSILKDLTVEHPAAKMMVELAKTQSREVGDGTKKDV
jgi:chaperonin GroEL (HSP60 family)